MKIINKLVRAGTVLFTLSLLPALALTMGGCPEVTAACQIVKVADSACTMIEFVDETGTVQQTPVASEDLKTLARTSAARRKSDAGLDKRDGGGQQ